MNFNLSKKLVPTGLKSNPNRNMKAVEYITIHNTGNTKKNANAKMHADYQYNGCGGRQASWHYTVDEKEIWQSFEDIRECWHAGDSKGNACSIGIEICINDKANFVKACENAAQLVADLLKKHKLTIDKVKQHFDWSKKNCPAEIRSGAWGITWQQFISKIKENLMNTNDNDSPIMGESVLTANELSRYLLSKNPTPKINCTAAELAAFFISEGSEEGIRGDLAFCQALHETGFFKYGGQVKAEQNNYCGLGATNPTGERIPTGASFVSPQIGARAQIQHLKAYATKDSLKKPCVDPRFSLVTRGCAPNWTDLNGRWAVPGTTYGQSILKLFESCPKTKESISTNMLMNKLEQQIVLDKVYWTNVLEGKVNANGEFLKMLLARLVGLA